MYSRVLRDFLNLDCSSLSSDDALDDDEEAEEENDDDAGATDEAAFFEDEDEAGGMMRSVSVSVDCRLDSMVDIREKRDCF